MPWQHLTPGKDPVPTVQEAGWASGPVWTGAENLAQPGFDPQTIQPVGSHYADYTTQPTKAYVPYEISGLALTTMGLKEPHICLLVIISLISFLKKQGCVGFPICMCVCVPHFFVNQHIQNPYLSNKFFPRNDDDDDDICRSRSLCSKILRRCCVLYAVTCMVVIRRSLGFDFEY